MLPPGRIIALCIILFVSSAFVSTSIRSHHYKSSACIGPWCGRSAKSLPSKYAFATFLAADPSSTAEHEDDKSQAHASNVKETEEDDLKDGYYQGARVLAYQLLHAPATRSIDPIPFLVIVTSDVSHRKRARLTADGATVIQVEKLNADWVHPGAERWRDVLAKLRLFQMTQYEKICFIDADMLVTGRLDGIFNDPATDILRTKQEPTQFKPDEAALPPTYMFAGKSDAFGYEHDIPPSPSDYLNSGFFVFKPSLKLFAYYISLLKLKDRFSPQFPEQNLLNYAHRREGNMPWAQLNWRWNMNWPTVRDYEAGAKSFHAKYWDGDGTHDERLKEMWWRQWAEMRGYYAGVEDGRKERG